jgi:hypothetical protein
MLSSHSLSTHIILSYAQAVQMMADRPGTKGTAKEKGKAAATRARGGIIAAAGEAW